MFRLKSLFRFLAVWLGIIPILSINSAAAFAAEKPEIFVQTGHASPVEFLAVDKYERYLVSVEDAMGGKYLKIWEISSGKEIRTIKIHYSVRVRDVYFTGSEKFAVVFEKSIEIYNIHGEKIEKIDLPTKVNDKTFITKNREFFYTVNASNDVHFYDIKDGSEIKIPEAEKSSSGLVSLGFGFSGVFTYKGETQYVIYDENLKLRSKGIFKGIVLGGKTDPNSKFLYEIQASSFRSYSLDTGELLCSINLRKPREPIPGKVYPENRREFFHFSVLPDGRVIFDYSTEAAKLGTGENKKLSIIKYLDNCLYKEKSYTLNNVTSYVFSKTYPGFLIHGHYNGNVKMLDLNTGTEIKSFGVKPVVFKYIYSVDGKLLNMETEYSTGEKRSTLTFNLWNIKEGKLEKSESSSTGIYKKIIYPSDKDISRPGALEWEKRERERWFLSDPDVYYSKIPKNFFTNDYKKNEAYTDISQGHIFMFQLKDRNYSASKEGHALVLYDPSTKSEIAKLYAFTDGEWVVITPEGYFNASPNGAKHLNVRVGNNVYGVDQFYSKFYRPELVKLALAGKEIPKGEMLTDIASQKPAPAVEILSPRSGITVSDDMIKITVKLKDNGGGIGNVNVYLNGSQIANDTRGVVIKGKESSSEKALDFNISLMEGNNDIKIIAFNKEGSMESIPATLSVFSKVVLQKPNLYAIVVGINEYKNKNISLNYAVSDAKAFAETLKATAKTLFENINAKLLISSDETTKESIQKAFEEIRTRVKPNDLFVFYNASHGVIDIVEDQEQYYLLTSNVLLLSSRHIGKDAMSQKELIQLIGAIPAQKKLIILDTCHAGKAGKEITVALLQQTRGLTESTAIKLLQRAVGSTVFSASSDTQQALEGYKGHGLFTYVLMEGLQGKADMNKDGFIKVNELADYVEERVITLSEQVFKRQQTPTNQIGVNFPIGKVK
ncbi:MAG: caspase family protein [Nitrospirae bacterium]|nr:caspase family protein [Nitrospirota bacterium]